MKLPAMMIWKLKGKYAHTVILGYDEMLMNVDKYLRAPTTFL
jgi:hypothetical protein